MSVVKQRYTKLPSDNRRSLATTSFKGKRHLPGKYPDYDISYTLAVWRLNNAQIKVLKKRIKKHSKKEGTKSKMWVDVYTESIRVLEGLQEEISNTLNK